MNENQDFLSKFVQSKSKFFDLKDGEEKIVTYLSVEPSTTYFQGKPVNCARFHFDEGGKEMLWDRTSRELAKQMQVFSAGDVLKIKVVGQKNQVKYFITKIK